jgi:hypothetical protein
MKQQHTIKVVQMTEEILAKMDAIHEKILDFVMANQQQILGNKTNKRREIIEEITRSVVKRDEDDQGNTYPPKMRIKVKFDLVSGKPKAQAQVYRKKGEKLTSLNFKSIEDFKQEFNMTSEKVIIMEPSFYVMGAQCGWTLALHSVLLGEKTVRQAQELPSFTADDLAKLSDAPSVPKTEEEDSTLQAEPEETEPEEEETNEPETAVIPSSDDEEETPAEEEEEVVEEEEDDEEEEEVPPPPKSTRKAPARRTARK